MRIRVGGGVVHCTLVRNACWLVAGGLLVAFGLAYLGEGDGPSVALVLVLAGSGILLALWMSLLQWVVVSPRGVFSPRKGWIPGATLQGMAWYEVGSNVLRSARPWPSSWLRRTARGGWGCPSSSGATGRTSGWCEPSPMISRPRSGLPWG